MNDEVMIAQCLNGERERTCDYCPAHSSRGGSCCFGLRHEYGHPDCTACVLEGDCEALTHSKTKHEPCQPSSAPRIIYPGQSPAKVPVSTVATPGTRVVYPSRTTVVQDHGPRLGEPLLAQQPTQLEPLKFDPDDNLIERFFKVSGWGALEGFCQMALNFFRRRRPE